MILFQEKCRTNVFLAPMLGSLSLHHQRVAKSLDYFGTTQRQLAPEAPLCCFFARQIQSAEGDDISLLLGRLAEKSRCTPKPAVFIIIVYIVWWSALFLLFFDLSGSPCNERLVQLRATTLRNPPFFWGTYHSWIHSSE